MLCFHIELLQPFEIATYLFFKKESVRFISLTNVLGKFSQSETKYFHSSTLKYSYSTQYTGLAKATYEVSPEGNIDLE